jgi:tetratricopeptide (TPR) repeat protein
MINPSPLYLIYYAIALYYQEQYEKALVYSTMAVKADDRDPFILYHHGIILMNNNRFNDALKAWEVILSFPKSYLTKGKYGEGSKWANSFLNDVVYYIAVTLFYKNDLANSIKYYKRHLRNRKRGVASFKTKREVLKELEGAIFLQKYEKKYPEKAKPILEQ